MMSCESTPDPAGPTNLAFTRSPEAVRSYNNILSDPSAGRLNMEINGANSLTERLHTPPCETCGVTAGERREGDAIVTGTPGNYLHTDREGLVDQIISNGPDAFGTTEITIGGQCYEVMNDSPTLPDGTYVPFTHVEATRMANQWGWEIPNVEQARAIRSYAESQNAVLPGITRSNDTNADRLASIEALLNDVNVRAGGRTGDMAARAERGRRELINGHFKWYVRNSRGMAIMGLSNGSGGYYHTNASNAHSSQDGYVDYSHGVRLLRRCQ